MFKRTSREGWYPCKVSLACIGKQTYKLSVKYNFWHDGKKYHGTTDGGTWEMIDGDTLELSDLQMHVSFVDGGQDEHRLATRVR